MKPMSLYESGDSNGKISLKNIINNNAKLTNAGSKITLEELAFLVARGGWPRILSVKEEVQLKIAENYYNDLYEIDIQKYDGEKKDPILAKAILKTFARHTHTLTANTNIFQDIRTIYGDVSDATLYNYIKAFKRLFILEEIPAWKPNIRSKTSILESPQKSFIDSSLAVAALENFTKRIVKRC